jgi:predicted nucleotidyltransferase
MLPSLSQAQTGALNQFCQRHSVKKMSFFGSVITSRFGPESDIDILIEFHEGKSPGFGFFTMQDELAEILGRPVDVTTVGGLHPLLKEKVLQTAETYYDVS